MRGISFVTSVANYTVGFWVESTGAAGALVESEGAAGGVTGAEAAA